VSRAATLRFCRLALIILSTISLSATTSLKSAVTRYIEENGRRYHAARDEGGAISPTVYAALSSDNYIAYFLPNDEVSHSLPHFLNPMASDIDLD
jgi:hypothetical protein